MSQAIPTERLIDRLSQPGVYPHPVDDEIIVHQTHISVVFLAGNFAYKLKKPLDLGFLDFSTLDRRRHFCEREVELNSRLAPEVYLDVVPITEDGGELYVDGDGEPVEWAVKMKRLPDEATLEYRLEQDTVDSEEMASLASHIADFHARARRGEEVFEFGRFETVAGNARENFEQTAEHVGEVVTREVYERVRERTEFELARLRDLIESRADRGKPCDTHGDLRLDHVYIRDGEFTIVDCIEFNDRFRYADPVSDIAFLAMDLSFVGRRDLSRALTEAYLEAARDEEGRALLDFYVAYRAVVRAKVEGIRARREEVGREERAEASRLARAHWLLALGRLEAPWRRPALVLVGGLPGTGKSTVARALAKRANFEVIDSDVVRKELAGLAADEPARADFGEGIYTPEWSARTYDACRGRAADLLERGQRVIVDATFHSDARRRAFFEQAHQLGVPPLLIVCETSEQTVRRRLEARHEGPSDADWQVYRKMADAWEDPSDDIGRRTEVVSTEGTVEETLDRALQRLTRHRLHDD